MKIILWLGVTTTWGTVSKGHDIRKVGNPWFRGTENWLRVGCRQTCKSSRQGIEQDRGWEECLRVEVKSKNSRKHTTSPSEGPGDTEIWKAMASSRRRRSVQNWVWVCRKALEKTLAVTHGLLNIFTREAVFSPRVFVSRTNNLGIW